VLLWGPGPRSRGVSAGVWGRFDGSVWGVKILHIPAGSITGLPNALLKDGNI
jgi:hypothetical protein